MNALLERLYEAERRQDELTGRIAALRRQLYGERHREPHYGFGRSPYCLGAAIGTASPQTHESCNGRYHGRNICGCDCHRRLK